MIAASVHMKGAFLTHPDVNGAIDRFITDAVWDVGTQGLADVHRILDQRIVNPTPFYETQLMVERQAPDVVWVHDRGVVYGPWLEGVGSRNKTTHFKGYSAFRKTKQQLSRKTGQLLQPGVERLMRRLGGG